MGIEIRSDAQVVRGRFIRATHVVIGETAIAQDDAASDHRITLATAGQQEGRHRPKIRTTHPLLLLAFPAVLFFKVARGSWLILNWTMIRRSPPPSR